MEDDAVASFTAVTGASPDRALQYLRLSDGNIEHAVTLFFETGGVDLGGPAAAPPSMSQDPLQHNSEQDPVQIDSDDDDLSQTAPSGPPMAAQSTQAQTGRPAATDDDEAMARRLQEEMYSEGQQEPTDPEGVRAPIARTRETLVGPDIGGYGDDDMHAAVLSQMRTRRAPRPSNRPGIFNQQTPSQSSSSIWNPDGDEPSSQREQLSRATGGASDASSKSRSLAEMYRPPFEITSKVGLEESRDAAREMKKWLLVNIQDPAVFDCQVLNRDLWKDPQVQETVRENFIFMQNNKEDPEAGQYLQYYFPLHDDQDAYPHISILDPRTGEQVKVWSGPPVPNPSDFVMQLHEFLDRYSLNHNARNPVAKRKPEVKKDKKIDMMSEEEMMEMALQNSLATERSERHEDPDELTRSVGDLGKGKGKAADSENVDEMQDVSSSAANGHDEPSASPFSSVSSDRPHTEPPQDAIATRIQFRHSGGRVIRRFALGDPVRRIYEWLKSSPLEGKEGVEFELVSMGRNLLEQLDNTIDEAGLKNGTVMVEFLED